jgi:hypothetical protein
MAGQGALHAHILLAVRAEQPAHRSECSAAADIKAKQRNHSQDGQMTPSRPRFGLPHPTPPLSMWTNQKGFMASAHPADLILSFRALLKAPQQLENSVSARLALRVRQRVPRDTQGPRDAKTELDQRAALPAAVLMGPVHVTRSAGLAVVKVTPRWCWWGLSGPRSTKAALKRPVKEA